MAEEGDLSSFYLFKMVVRVFITVIAVAYFLWVGYFFFQACGENIEH